LNDKKYIFEPSFTHQCSKLIKSSALTQKQIDETIELYKSDRCNNRLHYHKIICKKDKCRKSIAVLNSNQQYKILISEQVNDTHFLFIGHHRKYDRINKDC
jgi:hypothetical protein